MPTAIYSGWNLAICVTCTTICGGYLEGDFLFYCCASVRLLFPLSLSPTLFILSGIVSLARSIVSATSPAGGHGSFFLGNGLMGTYRLPRVVSNDRMK